MDLSVVKGVSASLIGIQGFTSRNVRLLKSDLPGRHRFMDVDGGLIARVWVQKIKRKANFLSVDKKLWSVPGGFINRVTICHHDIR